jgi:hypothetical protein
MVNNAIIDRLTENRFDAEEFHRQQRQVRYEAFRDKYMTDLSELAKDVDKATTEEEAREIAERECAE